VDAQANPKGPIARGPRHVPELDGVRGVAILMVMALHFVCSQVVQAQGKLELWAQRLTAYGGWGVDLFFVLSGFLITGILWDARGSQRYFRTFYARRTLRIFPLYYATLFVLIVLLPRGLLERYAPAALELRQLQGWLWPYLTNVYLAKQGTFEIPYVSHFWTLAVEEHFYLVWPFVVGLLSLGAAMRVSVFAAIFALSLRIALGYSGANELWAYVLTPCRLDALCIGAWLALGSRAAPSQASFLALAKRGLLLAAAGVLATSLWHVWRPAAVPPLPLRETCLALCFGFGIVLVGLPEGPSLPKALMRARWLRFLGKYSYGLYVFHGIIAWAFIAHHTLPWFVSRASGRFAGLMLQGAVGSVASMLIAVASYELFEAPFLKLKKRFESSPAKLPAKS
jgi:peptidoglycan/LPS O-acetylase OafA/YrhL